VWEGVGIQWYPVVSTTHGIGIGEGIGDRVRVSVSSGIQYHGIGDREGIGIQWYPVVSVTAIVRV